MVLSHQEYDHNALQCNVKWVEKQENIADVNEIYSCSWIIKQFFINDIKCNIGIVAIVVGCGYCCAVHGAPLGLCGLTGYCQLQGPFCLLLLSRGHWHPLLLYNVSFIASLILASVSSLASLCVLRSVLVRIQALSHWHLGPGRCVKLGLERPHGTGGGGGQRSHRSLELFLGDAVLEGEVDARGRGAQHVRERQDLLLENILVIVSGPGRGRKLLVLLLPWNNRCFEVFREKKRHTQIFTFRIFGSNSLNFVEGAGLSLLLLAWGGRGEGPVAWV